MRLPAFSCLTAIACAAALVSACMPMRMQRPADPAKMLDAADANKDGVLTRAEFLAQREKAFAHLDRNGDGYIDKSDVSAGFRPRQNKDGQFQELVARFDVDGDGRVSKAEFVNGPSPLFDQADKDHDGELNPEELAALKALLAGRRSAGR
jgi:Ca2+-binding EF-hand superfamily protein